ncbi:hypothetical protein BpHYR1_034499 [Brachionus plicatilis]|uniref:Uncharacterized protein n=1 Tax=Brachionus plicatilis TaxID=10195 RepID=A0A3M7RPJ3_BRAPC|nr:hypothetical protein BpHYR1_034499 [Brachionus plicatilis]
MSLDCSEELLQSVEIEPEQARPTSTLQSNDILNIQLASNVLVQQNLFTHPNMLSNRNLNDVTPVTTSQAQTQRFQLSGRYVVNDLNSQLQGRKRLPRDENGKIIPPSK